MSSNATPERCDPPRPVYETLPSAVRAAIASGTCLSEMNLTRWGQSYQCSEEAVRKAFEHEQWLATQKPSDNDGEFAK